MTIQVLKPKFHVDECLEGVISGKRALYVHYSNQTMVGMTMKCRYI